MDILAKYLYVLGNPMHPTQFRTFRYPSRKTPLGALSIGAEQRFSRGVGPVPRNFGLRAVVLLLGGGGTYWDPQLGTRHVQPGDLIHVFPNLLHTYGPPRGEPWHEIFVCFEGPLFDQLEETGILNRSDPVWRLTRPEYWERRIRVLAEQWTVQANQISPMQAVAQWMEFLAELAASVSHQTGDEQWLSTVRRMLDQEHRLPLSMPPEEIAAHCGMSYESLRKKFRNAVGCGLVEYHRRKIIERAAVMLQRSHLTHAEIAELLGFCDEFHFAKLFRKYQGVAPGQLRKNRRTDSAAGLPEVQPGIGGTP